MRDKEFVANGEAYITSRECEPMKCNFCGKETRTHIRVPSLSLYLWWCEDCQKVPTQSWECLDSSNFEDDYSGPIGHFESYLDFYIKSGYPYYRAQQLAIDQYRMWIKRKQSTDYTNDLKDEETPRFKMNISSIIDLNKSVERILSLLDDKERKVLALCIEEYRLDEILNSDLRDRLFADINTKLVESYSKVGKARALGYSFKDRSLKSYHKTLGSLAQKSQTILK